MVLALLAMNVLRMIKLFGWEPKINERVAEKRDDELRWIKKRRLLDLLNWNLKFVVSSLAGIQHPSLLT